MMVIEQLHVEMPCWSSEAQQVFASGCRVYDNDPEILPHLQEEGMFWGWIGEDELAPKLALVRWDTRDEQEVLFTNLRNLYR